MSSKRYARHQERGFSDMYLSTDDEGDEDSFHKKKARKGDWDAIQEAELAQAKRVAGRRMERHENMEIERAFAVLDNVREGEAHVRRSRYSKPRSHLNPLHNPFIENEAVEVADSDSDLAEDESFDTLNLSRAGTSTDEENDSKPSPPISQKQSVGSGSDLSDIDDWPTLYENYTASRTMMEAQIQQEQKQAKSSQSSNDSISSMSSSSDDQFSDCSTSDNDVESSMELEASFSTLTD